MPPQASRGLVWTVLSFLLIYAAAGSVVALIPGDVLVARLGSLGGSGDVSAEISARYVALITRARATSAVLLAGWIVLMLQRERLAVWLGQALAWCRIAANAAPRRLARAVQSAWTAHRGETIVFAAILLAGTALRLHYIGRDIRHDEAWTYIVYARRPVYLTPLVLSDVNHHPLNTLLIQLSVALFGNPVWAIRLPAFLFGVGCIPAAYALARGLAGPGAATMAAALVAGASPLIEFSVNARGYSAAACCSLLLLWAGLHAIRAGGVSTWPVAVLAAVLGTYANVVMILPGIMAFTWFAILAGSMEDRPAAPQLRPIVLAGLAIVAGTLFLYVPFFTVSGWDAIASSQGIKARSGVVAAVATIPRFADGLVANWARDVGPVIGWIGLVVAIASPLLARSGAGAARALLLAIVPALLFQFILVRDPGPVRIWLPFLAPLLVLLAMSLDGVAARWWPTAAPVLAVALTIALYVAVTRSGTLLTSTETAYFPGARTVAKSLAGMTAADRFATPGVRGDEVEYYALRERLSIEPIRTAGVLRIYRAIGVPASDGSGLVRLLIDKVVAICPVAECTVLASRLIPVRTPFQPTMDEAAYQILTAERE